MGLLLRSLASARAARIEWCRTRVCIVCMLVGMYGCVGIYGYVGMYVYQDGISRYPQIALHPLGHTSPPSNRTLGTRLTD